VTERLASFLNFRRGELPLAALSVLFHFCVLCGYYFLRPVRDAMGMSSGMDQLRWLFLVTSFVSLGIVLAFGGVVARTNRRRFIPIAMNPKIRLPCSVSKRSTMKAQKTLVTKRLMPLNHT
jgi:ATP/ADP translocase